MTRKRPEPAWRRIEGTRAEVLGDTGIVVRPEERDGAEFYLVERDGLPLSIRHVTSNSAKRVARAVAKSGASI